MKVWRGGDVDAIDAPPNNGMHPTANSAALIENLSVSRLSARRVMPSVRFLLNGEIQELNQQS